MGGFHKFFWMALVSSTFCFSAWAAGPAVGEKPPLLQSDELLQAPGGAKVDAESLRGKVVILEFWATWCGPCVAAIPHMNELAEKFTNQPVQFIAITAEDKTTIEKFLGKRPIKAWIDLDTNNAMFHAYGVQGIPHTVILNKDGTIAAITHPTLLAEKHISDLLAGKTISLGNGGGNTVAAEKPAEKAPPPLFQVSITPSVHTNGSSSSYGNGQMKMTGMTVKGVLLPIFQTHDDRVIKDATLPSGIYDFSVIQPHGSDADPHVLMREALERAFGLTFKCETNPMAVFVLRVAATNAPSLSESPTRAMSMRSGNGSVSGIGISSAGIASFLEGLLNVPVIDETGLTNEYGYDVDLKWEEKSPDHPEPNALKKAVLEQLGLELVRDRRPVEVLVVEALKKKEK